MGLVAGIHGRAVDLHTRMPGLGKLPFPAVGIMVGLILANAMIWVAVGILLVGLLYSLPERLVCLDTVLTCDSTTIRTHLPTRLRFYFSAF